MDVNIIIRSEVSQKEKEVPHDITYMWNLKCNTNEHICETETLTENRTVVAEGCRGGKISSLGLVDAN